MATIRNKTPRHKDYNLTQSIAKDLGEGYLVEKQVGQFTVNPRNGQTGTSYITKQIPSSIHFGPKEVKYDVPDAALEVPEIKAALAKGDLARLD